MLTRLEGRAVEVVDGSDPVDRLLNVAVPGVRRGN